MAASASQIREVGLVLQDNVAKLKVDVDAVNTAVAAMNFKGLDAALPTGAALKAQLVAYDAVTKATNTISDALAAVRAET